ncbi:hypothetical protein QF001_003309 [Paraburkholderia youngii]|uniref:hypothetical protein n=1 Tax=Paraburkholderia youngii TaxID=2782701 RepID=UPI003D1F939A
MSTKSAAYIARIHEHPIRRADGLSTAQMHADVARGVLEDDPVTMGFCRRTMGRLCLPSPRLAPRR